MKRLPTPQRKRTVPYPYSLRQPVKLSPRQCISCHQDKSGCLFVKWGRSKSGKANSCLSTILRRSPEAGEMRGGVGATRRPIFGVWSALEPKVCRGRIHATLACRARSIWPRQKVKKVNALSLASTFCNASFLSGRFAQTGIRPDVARSTVSLDRFTSRAGCSSWDQVPDRPCTGR